MALLTSLRTKVRVFSDIFRPRKTKVAHFTSLYKSIITIRSAAARCALFGSGKTNIPGEHQKSILCLHVNKPPNSSIAPQPRCQKILFTILLIRGPLDLMRNYYGRRGTAFSLCNYPTLDGTSSSLSTRLRTILSLFLHSTFPLKLWTR